MHTLTMTSACQVAERQPALRPGWWLLLAHGSLLGALVILGFAGAALSLDYESALGLTSAAFVGVAFWTLWSWYRLRGTIVEPYALFLMSAWSFNGAQCLLEVFGLNDRGLLGGLFSPPTLLRTEYLVVLAMSAMHFGALWSSIAGKQLPRRPAIRDLSWHTRWVGWFLLAISIWPAVLVFQQAGQAVMAGGYLSLYQRALDTGFATTPRLLANFLVSSSFFLLAGSKSTRTGIAVSLIIIGSYAVGMFFLGARAAASTVLIAYMWLFSCTVKRIRARTLVLPALVVVFVVFPLIRAIRDTRGADRTSLEFTQNAWSAIENPAVAALSEIGNSMSTVAYTLDLVPSIRPLDWGASYLYAALSAVPNVAWDVHPTTAHGTLSVWLVRTVQPATAAIGGGLGYSFIAEAYENFGWIGAPLVFLALGYLAGKVSRGVAEHREPAVMAVTAALLCSALIYARAETADFIRNTCWYGLLPFLLVRFLAGVRH